MKNLKLLFVIYFISQVNLAYSQEINIKSNVIHLINKCLKTFKLADCKITIVALETVQLEEAALNNYPCQSRVLALQSSLIMSMQDLDTHYFDKSILEEVKDFCF